MNTQKCMVANPTPTRLRLESARPLQPRCLTTSRPEPVEVTVWTARQGLNPRPLGSGRRPQRESADTTRQQQRSGQRRSAPPDDTRDLDDWSCHFALVAETMPPFGIITSPLRPVHIARHLHRDILFSIGNRGLAAHRESGEGQRFYAGQEGLESRHETRIAPQCRNAVVPLSPHPIKLCDPNTS